MFETPIFQTVTFQNKSFIVKRDDLTHPIISGNKAYKFYWLVQRLPNASDIKTIISYGGSQSNAMLALAQIAAAFNCRFEYWSRPLPKHVRGNLQGNLKQALSLGMHLIESQNITQAHLLAYYQLSNENKLNNNKKLCLITQGGANHLASIGFEVCASHIKHYLQQAKLKSASVIVPSGTGVSAFYLQQYLKHCNIVATACVGGQNYLTAQMRKLTTEVSPILPTVLAAKKYFGHCHQILLI